MLKSFYIFFCIKNLFISKTKNCNSLFFHFFISIIIIFFLIFVDFSIDFYNYSDLMTIKICDISRKWMLSTKLESKKSSIPHKLPSHLLCFCWIFSHFLCKFIEISKSIIVHGIIPFSFRRRARDEAIFSLYQYGMDTCEKCYHCLPCSYISLKHTGHRMWTLHILENLKKHNPLLVRKRKWE